MAKRFVLRIIERGIKPENLPPAENIKKVERRVAKEDKHILKDTSKLPKKKNKDNDL